VTTLQAGTIGDLQNEIMQQVLLTENIEHIWDSKEKLK
jgi:hypothetical protein